MRSAIQTIFADIEPIADAQRALESVQRRRSPKVFIVDRACVTLFCSSDLIDSPELVAARSVLETLLTNADGLTGTTFEPLAADLMLRIVPLFGERSDCYAVFIESVNSRRSLESAVDRYDITKREADVLALVVTGCSTTTIARRLRISEGTVGDHIKNLFRKMDTNHRTGLVACVFHDGFDVQRSPQVAATGS